MRIALAAALLTALAVTLVHPARAQDSRDEGLKLMNARIAQQNLTRAARLGTSANSDTFFVGHVNPADGYACSQPWHVGVAPYRPGANGKYNGGWDFDQYDGGTIDSMQGWVPTSTPDTRTVGTISDDQRPWMCLDWGNRFNASPVQGRTPGVVSAWHADNGQYLQADIENPGSYLPLDNSWTPLAGTYSAWCGLRAGGDNTVIDSKTYGGTGNALNGETVFGRIGDGINNTQHNFPGYVNQWDQLLYRDVRVATGGSLTVSFLYETQMDPRTNTAEATCTGWFDKDPLSMASGNFISASAYAGTPVRSGPVDSFMVYVGVPTTPTACQYADGGVPRPVFDLKRRWFSEVIAIDKPYQEILSTSGMDSVYRSSPFSYTVTNGVLQPMLDAQGAGDGGGVIRIVFRSKTNANYGDEQNTGGSFNSTNKGAVRIDQVAIAGCTPAFTTSGFETAGEIDNTIESANSATPGPAVGQGYALGAWHATGKSPKLMSHTHPLFGGDIGGGNVYLALAYADLCGTPDSPIRQCNVNNVIISTTDHDLGEAAGGALGTPFKENRNGILSPTINMVVTGGETGTVKNECGLDGIHVFTNADWFIRYDIYTGIFSPTTQGNVWGESIMSWPTVQKNGATVWGDIGYITGVWTNGDKQCFWMDDVLKPNIFTSNASGIPDSAKIWIFREQRCISWGVTTGCSPTDGHYLDNITLVLPPPLEGVADKISVDIWDWYTDAFPVNETAGLPGSGVAFDTCGAWIQTARNQSIGTGNLLRFDVPGDSVYVKAQNATGTPLRMDCVFRIYPGPGNYVTVGNKATALRKVPFQSTAAVSGDNSFWGQYLANNGTFGTPGGHPGGVWSANVWNSARCDTVEANIFPVDGKQDNLPGIQADFWQSTLHEDDPHSGVLGIVKNRCFLVDTSGTSPLNSRNITCSSVPVWLSDPATRARAGYDGVQTTREYTKVFPDGLLTPGSHVEYFFRMSHIESPTEFVMDPDTNYITPQQTGSAWNYDAMRWEGFSILPDRWKDAGYGGLGSACMLVVDYNDRRGDEKVWVGAADSIGATVAAKYGAHNGWHATNAYIASDGSHDFTGEIVTNDNNICVYKHGGQPGTTWDLYNVKAAESSTTGSDQIGSRLANRAGMGLMTGRQSMQGPTPEMLRTFYKLVFIMSGDLNNVFFGAINDRGQDDIGLVQDFLTYGANPLYPRGLWAMGHGFVEGNSDVDAAHDAFLTGNLGCSLRNPSYYALSGTVVRFTDLIPHSVVNATGAIYCAENSCLFTNDVLDVNAGVPGAMVATEYQNLGGAGPYISGVYVPSGAAHPYVTLVSGWDMWNTFTRHGYNTVGRLDFFMDVLVNVFGSVCPFNPCGPCLGGAVPDGPPAVLRDFVGMRNNPLVAGAATLRLELARPDRVEARVYDVAGRRVRTLADREFTAGEHDLTWDGTDDHGQRLARGVYFTSVRYVRGGFHAERKLTILR